MPTPESRFTFVDFRIVSKAERLDVFLSGQAAVGTRSHAVRLIREGRVVVNNGPTKASQPLHAGDLVRVFIVEASPTPLPEEVPLSVLYEDANVAVLDKPAGMVVHPAPGHEEHTLVNALLAKYPDLSCGDTMRPGIVHRLDKDTSGLMVVALNCEARDWLISQFKSSAVRKTYLALVIGATDDQGIIEGPIGRHPVHRKRMAVVPSGKPARTEFSVVERLGQYTLVRAHPVTGRTHQIRVHFAYTSHPVAGDRVYGNRSLWRSLESVLPRHFLHAASLRLRLPHAASEMEFTSPLPADLQAALEAARRLAA
ncbi:MAG: RluA family pseudouridine synthase [Dehalococcoidia bacterium]|nr:RluA family pseudouridine synthase [Dehalococcoidia bacterium]